MPSQYKACTGSVPAPKGALNKQQVARLIADLQTRSVRKDQCIVGLIAWYERLAAGMKE